MANELRQPFDVLVIGAGPAGIAAAVRAAECGAQRGTCGRQREPGRPDLARRSRNTGEKQDSEDGSSVLQIRDVTQVYGKRVFDRPETGVLLAEGTDRSLRSFATRI